MEVNLNDLEKIFKTLIHRVRINKGEQIEIPFDFFWSIRAEQLYDPLNDPHDLTLGQLSDEIPTLLRLLHEDDAIYYDIGRLANILKAICNSYEGAF
jgi:hypothetical protein